MRATFLEAEVHLTKTFNLKDGQIEKIGHPRILDYTSHQEEFATIEELYKLLDKHAKLGHCFLKGDVSRPLVDEPRAGTTNPNSPTRILLLDFDGIKGIEDVEEALTQLGLAGVDYIVQYSSSMGVLPERGLSAHVFMILDKDTSPAILKQWLTHQNLTVPILRQNLGLTRTYNSIRWPLDITTCQNDKLIYIAPPLLGSGVKDGFKGKRIRLVKKKKLTWTLNGAIPNAEANKLATETALNELREKSGLPKRPKAFYRSGGAVEYLAKPDKAIVTGVKPERGFVYLNLNGGDSWGYYHPEGNPEFIFNFKNEPNYKTSELLPEYYAEVKENTLETAVKPDASGKIYLAFRDFKTSAYYNGTYNPREQTLALAIAKNKDQVNDWLREKGRPKLDPLPTWDVIFDPQSNVIVDTEAKRVNLFQPTKYMKMKTRKVTAIPPTIRKVIFHALGSDEEVLDRFMNTLAIKAQFRERSGTAWVMHGTQGTGKGVFLNYVLRPLFGMHYTISKPMEQLENQFNGYMEQALILWIDESQVTESRRAEILEANLKSYIAEPYISVRKMHTLPYEVINYMDIFFTSNKGDAVIIPPDDRRYNVAALQPIPIKLTSHEVDVLIEQELEDFWMYLMTRTADRDLGRVPLKNAAKKVMSDKSRPSMDLACDALKEGNLEFFLHLVPTDIDDLPAIQRSQAERFKNLILEITSTEPSALARDEIHLLLDYAVGNVSANPLKFAKILGHRDIEITAVNRKGKTVRGVNIAWAVDPAWKNS